MKKTIDINLGGTAFTIDEDAYQALKNYLDDIVSRLPDEDADVINDIEARLSELLQAHLSIRYQVVDLRMVKAAMGVMGKPDEFGEKKRREEIKESSRNTVLSKKLYRNANDRWLGGVCSGIAAYLDTDTALIRVLTCLLVLLAGLSLWAYIILWIVIPKAYLNADGSVDHF